MDFYHFRPSCKVIKRSRIIKNPILTNFDEETIRFIITNEEEMIREGRLRPECFRNLCNFSRKVFVGGLPKNITEESMISTFSEFGRLKIDWPYKESTSDVFVPPKGFVFLLFEENISVDYLVDSCQKKGEEYFLVISKDENNNEKKIRVQIRPWELLGVDHFFVPVSQMNTRLTIFIGGVPRTLNAGQIGRIMAKLFGDVAYVGIDIDPLYLYPKGSARVIFLNKNSLILAVKKRFVMPEESGEDTRKMMEIKPYVLDDQLCDKCHRINLGDGTPVPAFLCPEPQCLSYLCDFCWVEVHSRVTDGGGNHKPIVKQGKDDYAYSLKKRGFDNLSADTSTSAASIKYQDRDVYVYSLKERDSNNQRISIPRSSINVKQGTDDYACYSKNCGLKNPTMSIPPQSIVKQDRNNHTYSLKKRSFKNSSMCSFDERLDQNKDDDANSLKNCTLENLSMKILTINETFVQKVIENVTDPDKNSVI